MRSILRFDINYITRLAERYDYMNKVSLTEFKQEVVQRGYLTKKELTYIAYWKAPRSSGHVRKNSEDYIAEITGFTFKTNCERARIECLTILDGVSWPTASVILHFFHRDPYPILDFRALWSVMIEAPSQYNFGLWWSYVEFCRSVAVNAKVNMRTLDKALWQ